MTKKILLALFLLAAGAFTSIRHGAFCCDDPPPPQCPPICSPPSGPGGN